MALLSEFVLQVPAFVVGLYALWTSALPRLTQTTSGPIRCSWRTARSVRCLTHAACFTTMQCIAMVTVGEERQQLSSANVRFLLQCVGATHAETMCRSW